VLVSKARDRTHEILMSFLHENIDKNIRSRIRIFILQIKSSRTEFSCGLFNFDWTLMYSVSKTWSLNNQNLVKKFHLSLQVD
jgi:hypothetical protein